MQTLWVLGQVRVVLYLLLAFRLQKVEFNSTGSLWTNPCFLLGSADELQWRPWSSPIAVSTFLED